MTIWKSNNCKSHEQFYKTNTKNGIMRLRATTMEQKGMTFDPDFCYFILLFSSLLKKIGKRKREWSSKNRDQKSYLSVPSTTIAIAKLEVLLL